MSPIHARRRLADGAAILDTALTLSADAPRCIRLLRGHGGLDEHFTDYHRKRREGRDRAAPGRGQGLRGHERRRVRAAADPASDALRAIRDDERGIELTTVHRAKGRQWQTVIVFGCDEDHMPHKRSLEDLAAGNRDALEAERRVAYVPFTRAQSVWSC